MQLIESPLFDYSSHAQFQKVVFMELKGQVKLKEQSDKEKAHMLFKRHKSHIALSDEEMSLVKRYYPFMR